MGFNLTDYFLNPKLVNGTIGTVVVITEHEDCDDILVGIDTGLHKFIVGQDGLEMLLAAPKTYQLTLSEEEKDILICILECIGGNPDTSPRKFSDSVYGKLKEHKTTIPDPEYDDEGWEVGKYQDLLRDLDVSLWFNDFPPEPTKNDLPSLKISIDTSDAKKDIEELTELLKQVEVIKNRIFKENT